MRKPRRRFAWRSAFVAGDSAARAAEPDAVIGQAAASPRSARRFTGLRAALRFYRGGNIALAAGLAMAPLVVGVGVASDPEAIAALRAAIAALLP